MAESVIGILSKENDKLKEENKRLKAENEELKKTLKEINLYFSTHCTDKRALYIDKLLVDCNRAEQKLEKNKRNM